MARGRMISKTLSTSVCYARLFEVCPELAEFAQSLYPLLVAHADDFGREQGDTITVKYRMHPRSPRSEGEFAAAMQALHDVGLIVWYEVRGRRCYQIQRFDEHQTGLHKRTRSQFPAVPGNSGKAPEVPDQLNRTEENRTELKRRELKRSARPDPAPVPTRDLLTEFDRLHRAHLQTPAVILNGKDAAQIARLYRTHGELVRTIMAEFFASDDPFIRQAGYTVGVFCSQAGKLLARRSRGGTATTGAADRLRQETRALLDGVGR